MSTERVQGMDRIKQMHTQKYMRVIGDRSNVENELDPKRHHQNQLSPAIIQTKWLPNKIETDRNEVKT